MGDFAAAAAGAATGSGLEVDFPAARGARAAAAAVSVAGRAGEAATDDPGNPAEVAAPERMAPALPDEPGSTAPAVTGLDGEVDGVSGAKDTPPVGAAASDAPASTFRS